MRIERIELLNFGSYEGLNVLDFTAESPERRIIIIGGKNGAGKTTLFTALQVCLYGYASFGYKAGGKRYLKEIYNLINNRARLDETKSAHIRLRFLEQGARADCYEMTRSWTWAGGTVEEELTVLQNGEQMDEEAVHNFQNYLLHLIPPELHRLYFFDGEAIADYFLESAQDTIKDALLVLSGSDTYDILYHSIRRLANSRQESGGLSTEAYTRQKEELARCAGEEQAAKEKLSQAREEQERLEAELKREEEDYAQSGGISLEEWKTLLQQMKDEEERRNRLNWELKSAAAEALPFLIVRHLLGDIREQIEMERRLQAQRVLQTSLDAPAFKRRLSQAVKKTSSQDTAGDTRLILEAIQSFFTDRDLESRKELFRLSEDQGSAVLHSITTIEQYKPGTFERYRRRIGESLQRSRTLRERLEKSSLENYEEHLGRVSALRAELERANYQIARLAESAADLEERREEAEKTAKAGRKALEAELKQQSLLDLSGRVLLLVEELQSRQDRRLLAAVERDLNEKFRQLIRKEGFVDHIYLDENFTLHLVRRQAVEVSALRLTAKQHGTQALKKSLKEIAYQALLDRLAVPENHLTEALAAYEAPTMELPVELDHAYFSNGEKQILVMSLYWAIMNQSRNELPFVIDTPFARIDTEHRANITERFFKELPGQLFVLSTNEELRHEHIASLDQQIAKVYTLEYGEDKRTHVMEGSYFEVE